MYAPGLMNWLRCGIEPQIIIIIGKNINRIIHMRISMLDLYTGSSPAQTWVHYAIEGAPDQVKSAAQQGD